MKGMLEERAAGVPAAVCSGDCLHMLCAFKPVWLHECVRIITGFCV